MVDRRPGLSRSLLCSRHHQRPLSLYQRKKPSMSVQLNIPSELLGLCDEEEARRIKAKEILAETVPTEFLDLCDAVVALQIKAKEAVAEAERRYDEAFYRMDAAGFDYFDVLEAADERYEAMKSGGGAEGI